VIKHAANCKHHLLTTGLKSVPTVVVKVTRIQVRNCSRTISPSAF